MKAIKNFLFRLKQKKHLLEKQKSAPALVMSEESRQKIIEAAKAGKPFTVKDGEGKVIYSYPEDHLKAKE